MFNGTHVIIYSQTADADRTFLRDQVGLANVDAGEGWLIFKLPPAELAVHPTDGMPMHELYFMCDDIEATLSRLSVAGAAVASGPTDQGWGLLAEIRLPSGTILPLYEPRHPVAHALP
jgi:hypothetical protein